MVGASAQTKTLGMNSVHSQSVLYLLSIPQEIVLIKIALDKFKIKNLINFKLEKTLMA